MTSDPKAKKKVDWSKYDVCTTCLQDVKEPCIHLHTNEELERPHSGREKLA